MKSATASAKLKPAAVKTLDLLAKATAKARYFGFCMAPENGLKNYTDNVLMNP